MEEYLKVLITAMIPIGELRAAIPLGLSAFHLPVWQVFVLSVIGNMIPIVFIVFLLEPVSNFLSKHFRFFKWFFNWLFERTRHKHSHRFEVLEEIALVTFVAIPLPVTGAWSGAAAAFVFGIPPKKSLPLILLGVLIAGVVVTLITLGLDYII
ncbi:MAG: small multi-drug export protein [Patescibacteria group bacterium]|nr:small multi-drug export protein [Patescibacteria group bacterium]